MTNDDLQAAQMRINEIETEAASIRGAIHEAIDKARTLNAAVRAGQAKLRGLDEMVAPIKAAVAAHIESANVEAKQVAIAEAQAEAARRATEPQPPSALELVLAELAEMRKQIAAKG